MVPQATCKASAPGLTRGPRRMDTDLRAWLFTIVHNEHVNRVRREVRRGPTRSLDGLEHGLAVSADQLHRIELREVSLAMEQLPREQRDVIMLIAVDRKSTRLNSSHSSISYAVFCLKKKNKKIKSH